MIVDSFSEFECALFLNALPNSQEIIKLVPILNAENYFFNDESPGYIIDDSSAFIYPAWSSFQEAAKCLDNNNIDSLCINFKELGGNILSITVHSDLNLITFEINEKIFIDVLFKGGREQYVVNNEKLNALIKFYEKIAGLLPTTYWRIDPSEFDYEISNDFTNYKSDSVYPSEKKRQIKDWYNSVYLTRWE